MPCQWCKSTGAECGCGEGYCIHCGGTGHVTPPPFGDGSTAEFSQDSMSSLATASTQLRCIGSEEMIQGISYMAAKITLPKEDAEKFVAYWADIHRDATLGQYIMQIAERAEHLSKGQE